MIWWPHKQEIFLSSFEYVRDIENVEQWRRKTSLGMEKNSKNSYFNDISTKVQHIRFFALRANHARKEIRSLRDFSFFHSILLNLWVVSISRRETGKAKMENGFFGRHLGVIQSFRTSRWKRKFLFASRTSVTKDASRFPVDPRRKGEILIKEKKASLERLTPFWINIRTKSLNPELAVT